MIANRLIDLIIQPEELRDAFEYAKTLPNVRLSERALCDLELLATGGFSFIEVYVNTPLEECERRDAKGMYSKARRGELKNFTGIDDPYEAPVQPELILETLENSA